jgi:hypothetical protein
LKLYQYQGLFMNERYNEPPAPRLSELEIRSLANRAVLRGEISDVDYPDEQLKDRPRPHLYALPLDPSMLSDYYENQPFDQMEIPVSLKIEYGDARVLEVGEPLVEATVYVVIVTKLAVDGDPVYKDTTYHLPLGPDEEAAVIEVYFDSKGRIVKEFASLEEAHEAMAGGLRLLTEDDVHLLRLII